MSCYSSPSEESDVLRKLLNKKEDAKQERMSSAKKDFEEVIASMSEEEIQDVFFHVNLNLETELQDAASPPVDSIEVPSNGKSGIFEAIDLTQDEDNLSQSTNCKRNLLAQSSLSSKQFNSQSDSISASKSISVSSIKTDSLCTIKSDKVGSTKSDEIEVLKVCTPLAKKQDEASLSSDAHFPNSNSKSSVSESIVGSTTKSSKSSTNTLPSQSSSTTPKNSNIHSTSSKKQVATNLSLFEDKSDNEILSDSDDEFLYDDKSSFFTENLRDFIDETHGKMYAKWSCELHMDMKCGDQNIPNCNILGLVENQDMKKVPVYAHFCPKKYPVDGGYKGEGFTRLFNDLQHQAGVAGFGLNCNQPYILQKGYVQRIVCKRHIPYQGNPKKRKNQTYRTSTLCNDRKNTRGKEGKNLPRRRPTFRAMSKEHKCPFRFNIGIKDGVFYVISGSGCTKHEHHPKLDQDQINIPMKLLATAEKQLLIDIGKANANLSVGVNAIYEKTGKILSASNVRYLQGLHNDLKPLDKMKPQNSPEAMVEYLKKNGYDHILLTDNAPNSQLENIIQTEEGISTNVNTFAQSDQVDVDHFITGHRRTHEIEPQEIMMIGIAWILNSEKRLVHLFPEILCVDTTGDTNNESRPLLTITGKDSNGKTFTVLRAFLPNEKAWVFNWIFSVVMPTLLGSTLMERVRHIICDGDPQECTQIDAAIKRHFPQVTRGRCGFHLVTLGWERHMGPMKQYKNKELYKKVSKNLKNWMYSWMKPSCETEAEYLHSKHLFFKFLNTDYIYDNLGQTFIDNVSAFLNDSVIPQEPYFCFYLRKASRHFEEYSNSPHEGTNNGLKHCASPVKPTHALAQSMVILSKNGERNIAKKGRTYNQSNNSTKVYSTIQHCADKLTPIAAHLLEMVWKNRFNYDVIRVEPNEYLTTYNKERATQQLPWENSPRPIFKRVRKVSYRSGYYYCSCKKHERMGIPCSHIILQRSKSS